MWLLVWRVERNNSTWLKVISICQDMHELCTADPLSLLSPWCGCMRVVSMCVRACSFSFSCWNVCRFFRYVCLFIRWKTWAIELENPVPIQSQHQSPIYNAYGIHYTDSYRHVNHCRQITPNTNTLLQNVESYHDIPRVCEPCKWYLRTPTVLHHGSIGNVSPSFNFQYSSWCCDW